MPETKPKSIGGRAKDPVTGKFAVAPVAPAVTTQAPDGTTPEKKQLNLKQKAAFYDALMGKLQTPEKEANPQTARHLEQAMVQAFK